MIFTNEHDQWYNGYVLWQLIVDKEFRKKITSIRRTTDTCYFSSIENQDFCSVFLIWTNVFSYTNQKTPWLESWLSLTQIMTKQTFKINHDSNQVIAWFASHVSHNDFNQTLPLLDFITLIQVILPSESNNNFMIWLNSMFIFSHLLYQISSTYINLFLSFFYK